MGHPATATLALGYDLGSLLDPDRDSPRPRWAIDSDETLEEQAIRALLAEAGHPLAPDEHPYEDRLREVCGLEFVPYADGGDTERHFLSVWQISALYGDPKTPDLNLPAADLARYSQRLAVAMALLGVRRPTPHPTWLLVASN